MRRGECKNVCLCSTYDVLCGSDRPSSPGVCLVRCRACGTICQKFDGRRGAYARRWVPLGRGDAGYAALALVADKLVPRDLLALPYVELVKYVPFQLLGDLRRRLECESPELLAPHG